VCVAGRVWAPVGTWAWESTSPPADRGVSGGLRAGVGMVAMPAAWIKGWLGAAQGARWGWDWCILGAGAG